MQAYVKKQVTKDIELFFEVSPNYVNDPTEGKGQDDAVAFSSGVVGGDVIDTAIEMSVEEARAFANKILQICAVIDAGEVEDVYYGFPISRNDEANFPQFKSVDEARGYFESRYGERYTRGYSELIGDRRIYFDSVDGQPVQIDENGFVHVVY